MADHEALAEESSLQVLVVDDDSTICQAMETLLSLWQCRVVSAHSLPEALSVCESWSPDLVIADYHLEDGVTGPQVIAALNRCYDRPVDTIIVTADSDPALREKLEKGGYVLLYKPLVPARLQDLIKRL